MLGSETDRLRELRLDSDVDAEDGEVEAVQAGVGDGGGWEEEDDDEEEEPVTLGLLEKPKDPRRLLRHLFPSKAGGAPAWLDPVNLPSEKSHRCGFCGEPLQFVLQVYAPLFDIDSAFHRMLLVFICPRMPCLLQDQHNQWKHREGNAARSVKVFRCQFPRINPFYASEPPKHDGTDQALSSGAPLCTWCGTWKGDKLCSSCKTARYCSEKHQALHWHSGHKNDCRKLICSDAISSIARPDVEKISSGALWPEHEIIIEEECVYDSEMSEDHSSAAALVDEANTSKDAPQSLMDQFEVDADKLCWANFQERIAKEPQQVLRYCRSSKAQPLWPLSIGRPSNADIPPCSICKGPMCFEFQIMPQLLYYFDVKNDPDSLDWATIVVYTCLASCNQGKGYSEEFAWVQLYPTMTLPS